MYSELAMFNTGRGFLKSLYLTLSSLEVYLVLLVCDKGSIVGLVPAHTSGSLGVRRRPYHPPYISMAWLNVLWGLGCQPVRSGLIDY